MSKKKHWKKERGFAAAEVVSVEFGFYFMLWGRGEFVFNLSIEYPSFCKGEGKT